MWLHAVTLISLIPATVLPAHSNASSAPAHQRVLHAIVPISFIKAAALLSVQPSSMESPCQVLVFLVQPRALLATVPLNAPLALRELYSNGTAFPLAPMASIQTQVCAKNACLPA